MIRVVNEKFNNFGNLRLLFASLVIVSHSPELIDGNRSRELLTRLFGTLSFGEVAVDGFFLVSGFLITKSFADRPDWVLYLIKRILRIYPGYITAFWVCVIIIAPLVGHSGSFLEHFWHNVMLNTTLTPPDTSGVLDGLPYPVLNGSMWTIAYEFRCYLLVLAVGLLVRRLGDDWDWGLRWILLAMVLVGLAASGTGKIFSIPPFHARLFGTVGDDVHFFSVFGVGALYYLFQREIVLNGYGAMMAGVILTVCLLFRHTAHMGFSIFGGYVIFWIALKVKSIESFLVSTSLDISYGLYLYAWPIASLIIWNHRHINPWELCIATLMVAGAAGFASWALVEKRANAVARLVSSRRRNFW